MLDALSRALERLLAREPEFQWYSRLAVNGNSAAANGVDPYGNFEYDLIRTAGDFGRTALTGRGAAHCYARRADSTIVWSTGGSPIDSRR